MEEDVPQQKKLRKENLELKDLEDVNLELKKSIAKMKKDYGSSTLRKRFNVLKTSYILTYKSLSQKKILYFWLAIILGVFFLFLSLNQFSHGLLVKVPAYGGTWNEGIIGVPRYINPVLAISNPDKDLTKLIFSGLLRKSVDGYIVNDLASHIEKSSDNLTYTIYIDNKAKFQDGEKVTVDDIIFTLSKIQDKNLNSPLRINFEGVTSEKIDDLTLILHLKKANPYFEDFLTFGILPRHILSNLSNEEFLMSDFNINPIGSGPFKIKSIKKESNIAKVYSLVSNRDFIKGRPFINNLNIYIYQNNEDLLKNLNSGNIEATSYLDYSYFKNLENKNSVILQSQLPNIFMLSLNPNKNSVLASKPVRLFLAKAIDKSAIINNVFSNYATQRNGFFKDNESLYKIEDSATKKPEENTEINITTADIDELKQVAENIANDWRAQGVKVNIIVYNLNELGDIIKNRNFEVLLFGSIIEKDTELYSYWSSEQRSYPGMNITNYASKNLDNNLSILKNSIDTEERKKALIDITEELSKEMPAIPIYSNNLNYVLKNKSLYDMLTPQIPKISTNISDRFLSIYEWYKVEEEVWKFTYNKNLIEKLSNILH